MGKRKAGDEQVMGARSKKLQVTKEGNNTIEQIDGLIKEVKSLMNIEQLSSGLNKCAKVKQQTISNMFSRDGINNGSHSLSSAAKVPCLPDIDTSIHTVPLPTHNSPIEEIEERRVGKECRL